MPIKNRFAETHAEITAWRRHLHQHPELMFDLPETSKFVEDKLRSFGITDITTGIAQTGVVAVIEGQSNRSNRTIGLRADMDALPIMEATGPRPPAKCMPAAMMGIRRCFWVLHNTLRRRAISMAASC